MYIFMYCIIIAFAFNYKILAQTDTEAENATEIDISTTTYSTSSTVKPTPITPNISCETHNNDCKACVKHSTCYYCGPTHECHKHWERVITDGECKMSDAYFLTCKANFKTMMIIIGVLTAIPVLIIGIVCCYCCCKKKGVKLSKDDIKWARQREERKQIAAEKRKERAERTEEIRKKYGLVKDSNPYQRFDA